MEGGEKVEWAVSNVGQVKKLRLQMEKKERKKRKKERGGREKGGPSLLHIINNHITVLWPFSNYLCCINYPEPEVKLVV